MRISLQNYDTTSILFNIKIRDEQNCMSDLSKHDIDNYWLDIGLIFRIDIFHGELQKSIWSKDLYDFYDSIQAFLAGKTDCISLRDIEDDFSMVGIRDGLYRIVWKGYIRSCNHTSTLQFTFGTDIGQVRNILLESPFK